VDGEELLPVGDLRTVLARDDDDREPAFAAWDLER